MSSRNSTDWTRNTRHCHLLTLQNLILRTVNPPSTVPPTNQNHLTVSIVKHCIGLNGEIHTSAGFSAIPCIINGFFLNNHLVGRVFVNINRTGRINSNNLPPKGSRYNSWRMVFHNISNVFLNTLNDFFPSLGTRP